MADSESAAMPPEIPEDDSSKGNADMDSKGDSPHTGQRATQHETPEVDKPSSISPSRTGVTQSFIKDNLTDTNPFDEKDAKPELATEGAGTNPQEKGEAPGNAEVDEPLNTTDNISMTPNEAQAHFVAANVEQNEPVVRKEAVQDPGLVDITDLPPESSIIDVDTFEDEEVEVSEDDEPAQSPAADELVSEGEDPEEPKNIDAVEILMAESEGEAIDLTSSPSTKPQEGAKNDGAESLNVDSTSAAGHGANANLETIVNIDEAHINEGDSGTQDEKLLVMKDDEPPEEDTPDTETISADVNMDSNGDDFPSLQIPVQGDAHPQQGEGPVDIEYSVEEDQKLEGGDQAQATRSNVPADHSEKVPTDANEKNLSPAPVADYFDADSREAVDRYREGQMARAETENIDIDDGSSSIQMKEDTNVDNGSSVFAPSVNVAPTAEKNERIPSPVDAFQVKESQDNGLSKDSRNGQFARCNKGKESALPSNKIGQPMTPFGDDKQSKFNSQAHEDDEASDPVVNVSKLGETTASLDPGASTSKDSEPKKMPLSIGFEVESSIDTVKTLGSKPVGLDVGGGSDVAGTSASVPKETGSSMQQQLSFSGFEPHRSDGDERGQLDDSRMVVDTGLKSPEKEKDQKVVMEWKAPLHGKSSSDKERLTKFPHQQPKHRENEAVQEASTRHDGKSNSSEVSRDATDSDTGNVPEGSKGLGTGHQAPLFGMQPSMSIKTGPVSFSSPPTFPRYSLNPQALPFFPSKRQNDGIADKQENSGLPSFTAPSPARQENITGTETEEETGTEIEETKLIERGAGTGAGNEEIRAPGSSKEIGTAAPAESLVHPRAVLPSKATPSTDKLTSVKDPTKCQDESQHKSELKLALKKPSLKKVSFAPTPIKSVPASQQERNKIMESVSTTAKKTEGVKKSINDARQDGQSALLEKGSLSDQRARPGKAPPEVEMKEKQKIIQVQTDEGLRREVMNVTVAIRQGNNKMRLERKKLTIKLTTGADENAKLQFFKGSGSSLKLYASLESKRDYLRVRKVTNRQYCMSVAKMAPPGDETADIIMKYFLHFDEQDTFEEMHSQCVANLQNQPKSISRSNEPEVNARATQAQGEEPTEDPNHKSIIISGTKRSAETNDAPQVSKKSKLLADKKKLLDKMAALRRKKEQKGMTVTKGRQSQLIATDSARNSLPSVDTGMVQSAQLKDSRAQPSLQNTERQTTNTKETSSAVKQIAQPSKRRATEKASNEKVTKKARVPGSLAPVQDSSVATIVRPGAEPKVEQTASVHGHGASKDEGIGDSTKAMSARTAQMHASNGQYVLAQQQSNEAPGANVSGVGSDSLKVQNTEALQKVTKDLKQAQKERDALQVELQARNQSLLAEKEKTSQARQEYSEAWKRVMTIVEALGDEIGPLRRDDTDRSLESLKRCEPSSSEDFFDRLHSFRPSTWAAFENSEIGALECALRGWHNSGPNIIQSSEGSEVALSPTYDDPIFRPGEVERIRSLLREGHSLLSGWIGQSCPESFRTVEGSLRTLTKENLKANIDALRDQGLGRREIRFDWGANALLLSDDVCERLAVYNWSVDGECLRCMWCNRRVAINGESRFAARSKHYAFCPFRIEGWKDSVLRNAQTLGIERHADIVMRDQTSAD